MVTVVDSKQKPLPAPEVMMIFASELNDTGQPVDKVIAALAQELAMPNTDQVQIGNTVFIGHRGKGKYKNVMEGRALNIDTARNFMRNGLKYIAYLQNKGVEYYRTDFNEKAYITAFQYWYRQSEGTDTEIDVLQLNTGGYRAFIKIGKDSLAEFWRL